MSSIHTLTKRPDFLRAASAVSAGTASFHLQARRREDGEAGDCVRVGFTCSKKVGNAVARNRAKRRLRAAADQLLIDHGQPGCDYVLIGRKTVTAQRPWATLLSDLQTALSKAHDQLGRTHS